VGSEIRSKQSHGGGGGGAKLKPQAEPWWRIEEEHRKWRPGGHTCRPKPVMEVAEKSQRRRRWGGSRVRIYGHGRAEVAVADAGCAQVAGTADPPPSVARFQVSRARAFFPLPLASLSSFLCGLSELDGTLARGLRRAALCFPRFGTAVSRVSFPRHKFLPRADDFPPRAASA